GMRATSRASMRTISAHRLLALGTSGIRSLSSRASHVALELARGVIVAPGVDLAVVDLEGPHDLQVESPAGKCEDVDPLRHYDRTAGGDVDDAELNALDAGPARTDERRDVVGNVLPAGDRLERNVVVHGVVGEERGQIVGAKVVGPRIAKPAHEVDRFLHLFLLFLCSAQFSAPSSSG